jgi:predicted enzyme related to lactoylglutathione lyase
MDPIDVALTVAGHLDALAIPYTIGGSLASSFAGEPRSTVDIDIVVDISEGHVDALGFNRATIMFLGLRTVIYHAPDLAQAKAWYTLAFGVAPYFDEPFYVGFEIGGYELGLDPNVAHVTCGNNAVAYWGVPDIAHAHAHMLAHGAAPRHAIQDVGDGIKVATVADPFGNVIGLIENTNFKAKS